MELRSNRRIFLATATGFAAATTFSPPWRSAEAQHGTPQPMPSPNAPRNQNVPGGMDTHPTDGPAPLPSNSVNAAQIVAMVQHLYQLAAELREETDRTNFKDMLPADFIKRAQQIEKLAKSIREKARG